MTDNEYKCAHCGGIFEKGRPDEEALAEANENFPGLIEEDSAVVCDDCFNKMIGERPEHDGIKLKNINYD